MTQENGRLLPKEDFDMEKLLKLEVIDNWMDEAEGLQFRKTRCDEFAEYLMKRYDCSEEVGPFAKFIAHFIWEKGDKKLEPWEVYAIWSTLEAEEERIAGLVNAEGERAAQEAKEGFYEGSWQEAYNHGLEEGYANGFYDGEHSERGD